MKIPHTQKPDKNPKNKGESGQRHVNASSKCKASLYGWLLCTRVVTRQPSLQDRTNLRFHD